MNIVCPLSREDEIAGIISSGADEIYCGVLPDAWERSYIDFASIDRRPYPYACLSDYQQLGNVVNFCRPRKIPVFLTVNEFYADSQFNQITAHLKKAAQSGVDGFIVADISLLAWIRKTMAKNLKVHVSGRANILNSQAINFLKEMGADRVIFPRQLTLEELKNLSICAQNTGLETEVYILNLNCRFLDGFCTFYHKKSAVTAKLLRLRAKNSGLEEGLLSLIPDYFRKTAQKKVLENFFGCCMPYTFNGTNENKRALKNYLNLEPLLNACGACLLYQFEKFKISHVKIVGRENLTGRKLKDISFLKEALALLKHKGSFEEYAERIRALFIRIYATKCGSCYYKF